MRQITIELPEILDLVSCAEDYGFADDVFMCSMYEFCGDVSDAEISEFAQALASKEGYSSEDGEEASDRLTEWRNKHRSSEVKS